MHKYLFWLANKHCFESNLKRTEVITNSKSNAPSYISVMQPTKDRHHFDNNTATSLSSYVTDERSLY